MCGVAGYWTRGRAQRDLAGRMGDQLAHRGPDDRGDWIDEEAGLALVHRRLAIVDLSPSGRQPMLSSDARWVLSFNGEIYNHSELRMELDASGKSALGGWRGHSDTEVLAEAIAAWGLETALRKAVGMFALSVWDRQKRRLHLARDRFGEKPVYYGRCGGDFVFASELKAIRVHPKFDDIVDREALRAFAASGVIPAPLSIYRDFRKLPPGTILTLDDISGEPRLSTYWSYRDVVLEGAADPFDSEEAAVEAVEAALKLAISGQSLADVPVGAFLSGGIDSSTIVALYQAVSGQSVRTYTIGFDEAGYDESAHARRIAQHLGTEHHEHRVRVEEAQSVIPLLPTIYDEPFADSSQIPTYLVSKFARADVKVAISGDGGDELFAGYNRHRLAPAAWSRMSRVPRPFRKAAGAMGAILSDDAWASLAQFAGQSRKLGPKFARGLGIAATSSSLDDVYDRLIDEWQGVTSPVLGAEPRRLWKSTLPPECDAVTRLTYADAMGYLPDDVLTKVDRAAMAVSLETRVPFLDHRVATVAARIPSRMKVEHGEGKQLLRKLLDRYVPRELVDRPKAGFAVPIGEWIKGPLRDWAEDLLNHRKISEDGYFDADIVHQRWQGHLAGRQSTAAIWGVLMFQAWLRQREI